LSKTTTLLQIGLLLSIAAVLPVRAATIEKLTVQRNHGLINVVASMIIEAPRPFVYQALSDYDHFSEMSDSFVESRFIEPAPDGTPRIYTKIEGCIWFFCKTINRTALLELDPVVRIVATVEPELSDAKFAREEWVFEDLGAATRIYYSHDLQPDFWVPPGIGVWAIKATLSRTTLKAAQRIEKMALRNQFGRTDPQADKPGVTPPDNAQQATASSTVSGNTDVSGAENSDLSGDTPAGAALNASPGGAER
jgi:hypothetical protein